MDDAIEPGQAIAHDVPCVNCGYNLRGLGRSQVCPECGETIERSLRGDWIWFSDPAWLRRMRAGTRWLFWVIVVVFVLRITSRVLIQFGISQLGPLSSNSAITWVFVGVNAVAALLRLPGLWLVTIAEPGRSRDARGAVARRVARVGMLGAEVLSVLALPVWFIANNAVTIPVSLTLGVIKCVGLVALFQYARVLATRTANRSLRLQTVVVMFGMCGVAALMPAQAAAYYTVYLFGTLDKLGDTIWVTSMVLTLTQIVFVIWSLVLLRLFGRAFDQATRVTQLDALV